MVVLGVGLGEKGGLRGTSWGRKGPHGMEKDLMGFYKAKCRVLLLGSHAQQCGLGLSCSGEGPEEVLVANI